MKKRLLLLVLGGFCSCGNNAVQEKEVIQEGMEKIPLDSIKKGLVEQGYQIFEYKDEEEDTTYLMQQYFIVFLKKGPERSGGKEETDSLMALHMEHLGRMYEEGYASISGPFGDDGDIRGITIYNTPTLEMADSLARIDPMVKSGRLIVETHPWWAAKGFPLR
ncbi:YciI family protein [Sinomicrobium weinanense]|uniref:YciI family protein n=1 Tax=Sinomicrobium weinanense TaxID=2842200 RepID=UPI003CD0C92C